MKKRFSRAMSAVCAAAMMTGAAAMFPAHAAETEAARIMGDVTGDKLVTMKDAKETLDLAIMAQIGLADNAVNAENNAADINMDGKIDIADARAILNYYCQTLINGQPLWSEVRKLSYHNGTDFDPEFNYYGEQDVDLPFAKRSMYLEIGCAQGKPGETVEIPVYIAGIAKLNGFQYFQKAPEELKCVDIDSVFGTETHEPAEAYAAYKQYRATTNTDNGALVWASADAIDVDVQQGMVIGTYYYQIPENAQSGDLFVLSPDGEAESLFIPDAEGDFAYTVLDGVVTVK